MSRKGGKHINTIKEDLEALVDKRLHWTLLTLPILGIVIFHNPSTGLYDLYGFHQLQ